ncbi:hypothetical protein WN982_37135 [Paraburkholderia sp. IMGN_8]|uniref:hypothetical protein n=1 Tax=Paraburkholderia sp. IMGN_8 TaxID=3136564 RepID=UPI0031016B8C
MTNPYLRMAAVALPVLMAALAAVAAEGPIAGVLSDAARVCQQLRATGASDIAKSMVLLRAKLPRVPADDAAAFEREIAAGVPDTTAGVRSPLYHVWLAGRYLDRATRQIGTIPTATSPGLRALMFADSANTAAGYVSIATNALLLGASQRAGAARGGSIPSDAQLGDYALGLQQIALMLNTLVMCNLRQPEKA